jgi:hypothetical protein
VQLGGDVGSDYVLDTDARGFDLAGFEELRHCSALLFGYCFIFLLDHPQTRNGQLELHLELCLAGY